MSWALSDSFLGNRLARSVKLDERSFCVSAWLVTRGGLDSILSGSEIRNVYLERVTFTLSDRLLAIRPACCVKLCNALLASFCNVELFFSRP